MKNDTFRVPFLFQSLLCAEKLKRRLGLLKMQQISHAHQNIRKHRLIQVRLSTLLFATFVAALLLFLNVRPKNEIHEYRPRGGGSPEQIAMENERGWPMTFSAHLRPLDEFTTVEPSELLNETYLALDALIKLSIIILFAAAAEACARRMRNGHFWARLND